MTMHVRIFTLALASYLLSGCITDAQICTEYQQGRRPIINGQPDTSAAHQAVVMLYHNSGVMCSGTLVSNRVILTAAHCVHNLTRTGFSVYFGTDIDNDPGHWLGVTDVWEHPNYHLNQSDPSQPTTLNDIAMVRLNQDAPSGVQPIPYLPRGYALTQNDVGITLTFVGFGKDQNAHVGRKLFITGSLGLACDGPANCYYSSMVIGPHYIAFDESSGGPCSGDSGGPALVVRNGQEYVAGVASYVDQNCQYFGASTKVDAYQTEIENFIGNTVPEDCTNGTDDDGDGLADCHDPECGSNPYCSGPTACEQPATLSCGQTVTGTTSGGTLRFVSYPCLSGRDMGPEKAFQLSIPIGTQVRITLTPTSGQDLDLVILPALAAKCNQTTCIAQSAQSGSNPETVDFTTPSGGSYVVVDSKDQEGTFQLTAQCGTNIENCSNGKDDDGDGLIDCADPDCASSCSTSDEVCGNGKDDDGDGLIDCADPDCEAACRQDEKIEHIVGSCSVGGPADHTPLWFLLIFLMLFHLHRRSEKRER